MFEIDQWAFSGIDGQISLHKWQKTIDLITGLFSAPSGYIVQATSKGYRVVIRSNEGGSNFETNPILPPQTPLFCRHVAETNNTLYVNDASNNDAWNTLPEVVEDGVESYLGLPIHWPEGEVFGTLCLKDTKITSYTDEYFELIEQLRDLIEDDLALVYSYEQMREIAMLDSLTNIYNRRALNLLAQQKLNLALRLGFDVCCLFIDINDFEKLNDTCGHEVGDKALIILADTLKTHLRDADIVGRLGGDEFVAVMQLSDKSKINYIMDKISSEYSKALLKEDVCDLSLSIGYSFTNKQKQPFEMLLNDADHAMYKNKQAYKLAKKAQ
ncbi:MULTISPECIES: sensor domain-containing diguanylate cyclase [Pseudoalteromonas]|uniref:sensor domain-containing diguanylate cyclase n=1 Tax=Pseudoalteromonas TaxID=53246 RepID=UPI000C3255FD|nr:MULTISPECIES: sensor domain-containing diguanylate cyclase [Pseudoalteromonas]PKG63948.1 sensor domain-containing diguanylate cyclase [Pseudoalteromonas arctica]PKG69299.1 sensor domain-containing diguanylate cyclase [Pseudoalteromonas sp. GutCa3]